MSIYLSLQGKGGCTLHQTFNFSTSKVLGSLRKISNIHIIRQIASSLTEEEGGILVGSHGVGVNVQDLDSTFSIRQTNLNVDLQTTRSQQSRINHILESFHKSGRVYLSVGHTNNKNVVQSIDTIDLGKQLVDNTVVHTGT